MDARRPMPFQFPPFPDRAPVFPDRMMREPQLPTAEISLWTVVAAIQAVERKVDAQASQLLNLEGRTGTAERLFSSSSLSAIRVVSSAYLRLWIFLRQSSFQLVLLPAQRFS